MAAFWRRVLEWIGDEWCGNRGCVPADFMHLELSDGKVVNTSNDAFELWIGWPDEWLAHMNRSDARKLAWFILWRWWIRGEWFGFRRWLYFVVLRRVVSGHGRVQEHS